jgi:putative ABC transport system permease protein
MYYAPVAQAHAWRTMSLVVRTREDPVAMTRRIEGAIASVAPTVAPGSVLTLEHLQRTSLSPQRVTSTMMATFAAIALLLAAIGINGVMSYVVAQRTHDIGVRMALGAQPRDVLRATLSGTMQPVMAGIGIGVVGAALLTRGLAHLLTQVSAGGPLPFLGAAGVLIVAAAAGSFFPARRAMGVDPLVALRREV